MRCEEEGSGEILLLVFDDVTLSYFNPSKKEAIRSTARGFPKGKGCVSPKFRLLRSTVDEEMPEGESKD